MTSREVPPRWEDDPGADMLVRRLMRAGKHDGPSARALRAAPAGIVALLSASGAEAAGVAGAAGAVAAKSAVSALVLARWFGGGILAGTALMAAAHAGHVAFDAAPLSPPTATNVAPIPAASAALQRQPRVSPSLPDPVAPASVAPAPAVSVAPAPVSRVAPSTPPSAPKAAPSARTSVAREIALLDAARASLVAGNPAEALRVLDALEHLPGRTLGPEATVLRVRALLARGDVMAARDLAASFERASPDSPQAAVLRSLIQKPSSDL